MRLFMHLIIIALLLATTLPVAHGASPVVGEGMIEKAEHGFVNLLTGWIELPMQIKKGYDRGVYINPDKPAAARSLGLLWGTMRGLNFAIGRTLTGAYQLVGFWTANPESNLGVGVPFDGEYVFDYGLMHATEMNSLHTLYFNKITRGGRNIGSIIVDWPIPFMRDPYHGTEGFGKRLWFVPSRFVYGVMELFGFWLPSAQDTEGYSFDYPKDEAE